MVAPFALVIAVTLAVPTPVSGDADTRVTCTVPGDPLARVYVLERTGGSWRLSFQSTETTPSWVRLPLPGARPQVTDQDVVFSYRNGNGGRIVSLSVHGNLSTLDVWVDYGLDVNIDPDLDPRVDLMNTHGPLDAVRCTVARAP